MTLLNTYVINTGQIGKFLDAIREGQAPEKFNRQHLKDLGFTSSNHLAFLPLLKGIGFLTAEGTPTQRYKDYLDRSRSKKVLGDALREAYSDIFTLRANPKREDRDTIAGKYRSTYNSSANTAELAAKTFLGLFEHADISESPADNTPPKAATPEPQLPEKIVFAGDGVKPPRGEVRLHYNIQIHLPPSKDIEVYNAIFKSLKEHLLD
jgi:hypothetical protein